MNFFLDVTTFLPPLVWPSMKLDTGKCKCLSTMILLNHSCQNVCMYQCCDEDETFCNVVCCKAPALSIM